MMAFAKLVSRTVIQGRFCQERARNMKIGNASPAVMLQRMRIMWLILHFPLAIGNASPIISIIQGLASYVTRLSRYAPRQDVSNQLPARRIRVVPATPITPAEIACHQTLRQNLQQIQVGLLVRVVFGSVIQALILTAPVVKHADPTALLYLRLCLEVVHKQTEVPTTLSRAALHVHHSCRILSISQLQTVAGLAVPLFTMLPVQMAVLEDAMLAFLRAVPTGKR